MPNWLTSLPCDGNFHIVKAPVLRAVAGYKLKLIMCIILYILYHSPSPQSSDSSSSSTLTPESSLDSSLFVSSD